MSQGRDWPDTLALQDKLNTHLLQGRRSSILLNKHIRRLKSVKAYILNEKAKVKTELTDYVNKLLENLLDFKSEMLQQLDDVVKAKFDELSMIKTGLEEDIDTLTTLCEETEKLLQFDSEITTYADVHRAETLQKAFGMVNVKSEGEQLELGDILTLKFEPTVDVDRLNCRAFGSLKPPVNSNGSEELPENVSDTAFTNLNYNNNANTGKSSTNSSLPSSGVDVNSNAINIQTDINSNLITNTIPSGVENKTTGISGIDPAELAAYINELSLAQANNTLAYWLSQMQIQNIPLPSGDPQSMNQVQVQNIPLPEGSQPVQQSSSVPVSATQSMSIPMEKQGNAIPSTIVSQNNATGSGVTKDGVIASVPVVSVKTVVTDVKPETMESVVREKTPPPPGFSVKVTEESKMSRKDDRSGQKKERYDGVNIEKKEIKHETITIDKDVKSKDQKSKNYIKEAKLNISCHSPKLAESSFSTNMNEASHSQCEKDTKTSECKLKESETTEIEEHEYIDIAMTKKAERSLDDIEDTSDEEECIDSLDDCRLEQDDTKVLELGESKKEVDLELEQVTAVSHTERVASVENSESEQKNVSKREVKTECDSYETPSVKTEVTDVIESNEPNEETRHIEAPKPLRRPLSLPRIPYKGINLNIAKEDTAYTSKSTENATVETTELKTAKSIESNDKNGLPTDERDEKKYVDSDLIVEKKVNMNDEVLSGSKPDPVVETAEMEDPLTDNDTTSVFDKIVSPEKQVGQQDGGELDNTDTNEVEPTSSQTSLPDSRRKSRACDNRTSSERNMDALISQTQWCKNYIQKTLSPKMKKKNENVTDVSIDKESPQGTCPAVNQSIDNDNTKPAKTDTDKNKTGSSEVKNLRSLVDYHFKSSEISPRRRVSSTSHVSESWDLELEESANKSEGLKGEVVKTESLSQNKNETFAARPAMSEKSKEAMKTQATWCRNLIQQTLSPSSKKKNVNALDTDNLDGTKKKNDATDDNKPRLKDSKKPSFGMTVRIPVQDVKQIIVPVSESGESWDIDETLGTNNSGASQSGKTVAVKPVQRTVQVRENMSHLSVWRSESNRERSVLQEYRAGSRKTAVKGEKLRTVGSMGKGSSSGLYFPIGVTTNSFDDIIITDTGNHLVKMYDCQGLFVKTIGKQCSPPMRRPSAIVVNNRDEIFVKDDICIRKFDRTGASICDIGKNFFHRPYGLELTEDGILIVLETHYQNPSLVHLTQGGEFIQGYPYQPLLGAPVNSKCRFMAVSRGTVIVSDLGLSQVYLTDLQGCFLQVVGRYGRGPMEFIEPSGVAADRYGNFLVGDSKNNKIKIWQCDGTFLGTIDLSDTYVVRPSGIHLTDDNRVLVTNYLHHQVKVYRLEL